MGHHPTKRDFPLPELTSEQKIARLETLVSELYRIATFDAERSPEEAIDIEGTSPAIVLLKQLRAERQE